jgi:hypothetical protein
MPHAAVDGLSRPPVDVLVAVSPGDPAQLGAVPDSVHVSGFVPQAAVLRHADLVVHHGGTGTGPARCRPACRNSCYRRAQTSSPTPQRPPDSGRRRSFGPEITADAVEERAVPFSPTRMPARPPAGPAVRSQPYPNAPRSSANWRNSPAGPDADVAMIPDSPTGSPTRKLAGYLDGIRHDNIFRPTRRHRRWLSRRLSTGRTGGYRAGGTGFCLCWRRTPADRPSPEKATV